MLDMSAGTDARGVSHPLGWVLTAGLLLAPVTTDARHVRACAVVGRAWCFVAQAWTDLWPSSWAGGRRSTVVCGRARCEAGMLRPTDTPSRVATRPATPLRRSSGCSRSDALLNLVRPALRPPPDPPRAQRRWPRAGARRDQGVPQGPRRPVQAARSQRPWASPSAGTSVMLVCPPTSTRRSRTSARRGGGPALGIDVLLR